MPRAALKLVSADPVNPDVLPFERRQNTRRPISGRFTTLQKSSDDTITRNRICSLQLLDISESGLGGIIEEPVDLGTTMIVFFPPHGTESSFDRYGHVVRCTVCDEGYRVGVRLTSKFAA